MTKTFQDGEMYSQTVSSKGIFRKIILSSMYGRFNKGVNTLCEVKTDIQGTEYWRNSHLISLETAMSIYNVGICISVNDGEYCSVSAE